LAAILGVDPKKIWKKFFENNKINCLNVSIID
jgi:lambda repressor-like predicted transcriptional regulator